MILSRFGWSSVPLLVVVACAIACSTGEAPAPADGYAPGYPFGRDGTAEHPDGHDGTIGANTEALAQPVAAERSARFLAFEKALVVLENPPLDRHRTRWRRADKSA